MRLCRLLLWVCASSLFSQNPAFDYTVDLLHPETDRVRLTITLKNVRSKSLTFYMPAWAPGSYKVVNFGRWVDSVEARDIKGQPASVSRKGLNEWQIKSSADLKTLSYIARDIPEDSVEALPTSLSEITPSSFFANGTAFLGYFKSYQKSSCSITYSVPCGWRIWCGLPKNDDFKFFAASYDELVDAPVLAGGWPIEEYSFELGGARYVAVVNAETEVKMDTLLSLTKLLIRQQMKLFSEVPFQGYVFLYNFFSKGSRFGALEHSNSSAYYLPPPAGQRMIRQSYIPRVIAHELFHLWNPKRIRPKELSEFNYQQPVKLNSMWFIEGLTEYYAKLTMVRSGVTSRRNFYQEMKEIAQSNIRVNLESLSQQAAVTGVASEMYTQGALVSFFMDIELREKTDNRWSLDSLMVNLFKSGKNKPATYDDKKLFSQIKSLTGVDLTGFYKKHISGNTLLPYRDYFEKAGITYDVIYPPYNGWYWDINDKGELVVGSVADNSTASLMGLKTNDKILSVQGKTVPQEIEAIRVFLETLETMAIGTPVEIKLSREGKPLVLKGTVIAGSQPRVTVKENSNASETQKKIRESIFSN